MLGARRRVQQYLDVVRPWATGVNNRGWFDSDFTPEAVQARLDPTHVIFPIKQMWLNPLDAFFLSPKQYASFLSFQQSVESFNGVLNVVNSARRDLQETYLGLIKLLHVHVIGSMGTGGLYDAFHELESEIS